MMMKVFFGISVLLTAAAAQHYDPLVGLLTPAVPPPILYAIRGPVYVEAASLQSAFRAQVAQPVIEMGSYQPQNSQPSQIPRPPVMAKTPVVPSLVTKPVVSPSPFNPYAAVLLDEVLEDEADEIHSRGQLQGNQRQLFGLGQMQNDQLQGFGIGQAQNDQIQLFGELQSQGNQRQVAGLGQAQDRQLQGAHFGQPQREQFQIPSYTQIPVNQHVHVISPVQGRKPQASGMGQAQGTQQQGPGIGQLQNDQSQLVGRGQAQGGQLQYPGLGQIQASQAQFARSQIQNDQQQSLARFQAERLDQAQRRFFQQQGYFPGINDPFAESDRSTQVKKSSIFTNDMKAAKGYQAAPTALFDESTMMADELSDEVQDDEVQQMMRLEDALADELTDHKSSKLY